MYNYFMKKFYKNTTDKFLRKAYYCSETFNLFGHGIVNEDKLLAFEEKDGEISIYENSIDSEVLQLLIDSGYVRVENVPTLMFLNHSEETHSKEETLEMGGWEEVHFLK